MGFFSGIRRRIKKIIPKEVRPFIPFIAAAVPGMAALGPIASPFTKAALARIATDDEADVKDALRAGAIAAAPAAISKGVTSAAGGSMGEGIANFLNKSRAVKGGTSTIARGIEGALNPETFMGQAKLIGGQATTDFGIKQAELNEKALEQYNADLLSRGIRDKAQRRSAIFSIFTSNGYDEDEVNVMLDKYGYADGGRVKYANGKLVDLVDMDDVVLASMKGKKRTGKKTYLDEEGGDKSMTTLEEIAENARDKKDLEGEEEFDVSEFSENLQAGIGGLEKAFGQPLGGRRPEPMRIIPGFAEGGDVDEVMEFDEEIITPDYLMKEEGVPIQEQVSNPNAMDELNSLSLDMFGKPVFELTEEEFEMLKDFASQQASAYTQDEIDMYENYKYDMNEQMPGMPIMEIDEFLRMEYGQGRLGVKKGGKVIKIMPEGVLYKGKAKDYPGIKQLIKDMKKKGTRPKKAEGGLMSMGGNELDLRGGGFVPMGKKERADDVPARLSKNEFVMTADAVRAAGGGSVQKGADLMYDTMKKLEAQS